MSSHASDVLISDAVDRDFIMEDVEEEEQDPFLRFIDYAKSVLLPEEEEEDEEEERGLNGNGVPGWNWTVSRIIKTCNAYSSGVTSAILLSELTQAWDKQHRTGALKRRPECITQLKKKHRRKKLPNTVTIDSIYEKNFLSLSSVLEAVIVSSFLLPGTNIYMLTLGDFWSSNTLDLYLHRRFYNLVDHQNGILKKGREIFLTGCYFRSASDGAGHPRLLPTEYLVTLLNEDQDDDAMVIVGQFCSDSFSSISLDAVENGVSYSLFARIESIGSLEEIQGVSETVQKKQITLVDNDGVKLKFYLWGEQVLLANLFSVGSMLGLDTPFIATSEDELCKEICLEYGSATQLYLVPFIQHEEQVRVALTQNRHQGSRASNALDFSQNPIVSQVTLLRDFQGSIDFSNYPFRSFVADLDDKMTSVSLYGVVTDMFRERNTTEAIFSLKIEDKSGAICAKLHFPTSWSKGRLGFGHTIFISGLTCTLTKQKLLEAHWFENDGKASFVNLSSLPALLTSSCLHKLSYLCDLTRKTNGTQICRIWLDQVEQVNIIFTHALCGNFVNETSGGYVECNFCHCISHAEVVRVFHLKVRLADETAKIFAWCTGHTAAELLQISSDEFCDLTEEEQLMYPSSLESEKFMVAMVNCNHNSFGVGESSVTRDDTVMWEITRAHKL